MFKAILFFVADQAYRNSINILAQTKDEWEGQMEKTCHVRQELGFHLSIK
jgi:hypothetical protein